MAQRTYTALYDSSTDAERARDDLIALGIPNGNISIRGAAGSTSAAATTGDDRGFWESLKDLFLPEEDRYTYAEGLRRGGQLLTVSVPEGLEDQAVDVLERSAAVDIDARTQEWQSSGWQSSGYTTYAAGTAAGLGEGQGTAFAADETQRSAAYGTSGRADRADEGVIQVAEEELRVGKREVGRGGVRVRSYVREIPVEEQVTLREESVQVERRPVDRPVQAGDAAFREVEIEAAERGEEAVASKEARVVEEIALRKDVDTRTETVSDTVRKQEVDVEDTRTTTGTDTTRNRT